MSEDVLCSASDLSLPLASIRAGHVRWVGAPGPAQNHVSYGATCGGLIFSAAHYTFLKVL